MLAGCIDPMLIQGKRMEMEQLISKLMDIGK